MQRPYPHVKVNFALLFDRNNRQWQNVSNIYPQFCVVATDSSDAFGHWVGDKLGPSEIFVAHLDLIKRDDDLSATICCPNRKSGSEKCLKPNFVASYFFENYEVKNEQDTPIYIFKRLFNFSPKISQITLVESL